MLDKHPSSARAARTRAALIVAGFDLLVERPIDAIPIDDVVAKAGVGKGSFFNHFADKQAFASAIGSEVRQELEDMVGRTNAGITDPVERVANGMRTAASFALAQPKRCVALLRSQASSTARDHALNKGLLTDIEDACAEGLFRPEAKTAGVLYWLGLCQILMANIIERKLSQTEATERLREMLVLGLNGLGVAPDRVLLIRSDLQPSSA